MRRSWNKEVTEVGLVEVSKYTLSKECGEVKLTKGNDKFRHRLIDRLVGCRPYN